MENCSGPGQAKQKLTLLAEQPFLKEIVSFTLSELIHSDENKELLKT